MSAEVRVTFGVDLLAELLERRPRPPPGPPGGLREPLAEPVPQFLQGAPEDLAGRLEFGSKPEEAELLVP